MGSPLIYTFEPLYLLNLHIFHAQKNQPNTLFDQIDISPFLQIRLWPKSQHTRLHQQIGDFHSRASDQISNLHDIYLLSDICKFLYHVLDLQKISLHIYHHSNKHIIPIHFFNHLPTNHHRNSHREMYNGLFRQNCCFSTLLYNTQLQLFLKGIYHRSKYLMPQLNYCISIFLNLIFHFLPNLLNISIRQGRFGLHLRSFTHPPIDLHKSLHLSRLSYQPHIYFPYSVPLNISSHRCICKCLFHDKYHLTILQDKRSHQVYQVFRYLVQCLLTFVPYTNSHHHSSSD